MDENLHSLKTGTAPPGPFDGSLEALLGESEAPAPVPTHRAPPGASPRPAPGRILWPALTGSLSLFVPGAGQVALGERQKGLFFLTGVGFLVTLAWAVLGTLDRLSVTLPLLGLDVMSVFWVLGAAYGLAAALHLGSVLGAAGPVSPGAAIPHPALAGVASLLVPGWGQVLNGDRVRAGLFLTGLWIVSAVWLATSAPATSLINTYVPVVSVLEQTAREPYLLWLAKWTAPLLLWSLAVYDAASSAAARR